jgi:hypothetical protein
MPGARSTYKNISERELLFIVLNVIDYCTTNSLLFLGGEEVMPLGVAVIESYGMLGLFLYKIAITAAVVIFSKAVVFRDNLWDLLNGVFTGIVFWNNLGVFLSIFM